MKTAFIAKAGSIILACSILALFLVPTGYAFKQGDAAVSETSCDDVSNTLTIFPYARLKTSPDGLTSGVEIHLSDVSGDCSTMIFSSRQVGYDSSVGGYQEDEDRFIAIR